MRGVSGVKIEERRIQGIEKQIGFLKNEVCKKSKKATVLFLLGLVIGLLTNILFEMLLS